MPADYRKTLSRLLVLGYPTLAASRRLEFRSVFGAVGAFVNGRIFATCGKFGLALRLPPEVLRTLIREKNARPLKYFPNGHVKREYGVLRKRVLEDRALFRRLAHASVRYALTG